MRALVRSQFKPMVHPPLETKRQEDKITVLLNELYTAGGAFDDPIDTRAGSTGLLQVPVRDDRLWCLGHEPFDSLVQCFSDKGEFERSDPTLPSLDLGEYGTIQGDG